MQQIPDNQPINILLTCPHCGNTKFIRVGDDFMCIVCHKPACPEEMGSTAQIVDETPSGKECHG